MEERYNKIIDISFKFGVRIIKLFQYLVDKKVNFAIPNQILRSGTSIGANVNESVFAQSKKDFINKMKLYADALNKYIISIIGVQPIFVENYYVQLFLFSVILPE